MQKEISVNGVGLESVSGYYGLYLSFLLKILLIFCLGDRELGLEEKCSWHLGLAVKLRAVFHVCSSFGSQYLSDSFHYICRDETHKVDVINFAQNKAKECTQNENLMDQESARLLWDFIVLLCRQNGVSCVA